MRNIRNIINIQGVPKKKDILNIDVKSEIIQKRAIRLITCSNYIAHTEPLFIQLARLLKVQNIFKLRLSKFYYKLCYGTLPHYFNHYHEIIERQPVRPLRQHQYQGRMQDFSGGGGGPNFKISGILAIHAAIGMSRAAKLRAFARGV